jgi:putative flavoprotein involved in K+ transport
VSLQSLAARGVTLLGRLEAVDGTRMRFGSDLAEHIRFADGASARIKAHVEEHIARLAIDAPPSDPDPADAPVVDVAAYTSPSEIDLTDRGIRTVIFTTGFSADLSWLHLPALDDRGAPLHDGGRSPIEGLWFLGRTWLRTRKSGIIWGAGEDSAHVVGEIARRTTRGAAQRA